MRFRANTAGITAALFAFAGLLGADQVDDALNKIRAYSDGISALTQNKNAVASVRLEEVAKMDLEKPAKLRVLTRLAEAKVRDSKFEEALALFAEPGLAADPQASYWQALALLGNGQAGDAERILATLTTQKDHPHWAEATLTRSSLLIRFGAPDEAIAILSPLGGSEEEPFASRAKLRTAEIYLAQGRWDEIDGLLAGFQSPDAQRSLQLDYLRARSSLGKQDWATALGLFEKLSEPDTLAKLPPNIRDGASIGLARALYHSGDSETAIPLLYSYIDSNPDSPNLSTAFELLEEIGVFEADTLDERLVNWGNSPSRNLAATATYYFAIAQMSAVNNDAAAVTLETIRSDFIDHPIAEKALLSLSEIYVAGASKTRALEVLADLREISQTPAVLARIDFIEARASYEAKEFQLAADKFAEAATSDETATATATYNSAIAALKAGDAELFDLRTQSLTQLGDPLSGGMLLLERALYSARLGKPEAGDLLDQFLADHPDHPRNAEAHLALAYLELNQDLAKIVSARTHLEQARQNKLEPRLAEEADYIAFWIDVADNQPAEAIASGEKYVEQYPESARAPEILFKMGSIHFRDGSFPAAQTNFERLASKYPTSPRAEIALFTAGRAAMRTGTPASIESAIGIFAKVSELGGEFAHSAKLQQALVRRTQVDVENSLAILEDILKEKPTGELLFSTLITKGETLFILGSEDPASLAAAITVYESIAEHPEATPFWRNQALTRKGKCLELASRVDEALAAYEQVISAPEASAADGQPVEYVWFYKAGFAAIRIYEEKENWKAAIATANVLAAKDGPGAQSARERSKKLETKHFIWRD